MKTAEGVVVEVINNTAKIKAGIHSECKNCGACPGNNSVIISVRNTKGAQPGQRVLYEIKETNAIIAAFIVFILPLIALFGGVFVGSCIGTLMGTFNKGFEILCGIFMLILSIILIKFFDYCMHNNEKSKPKILKIL